MVSSSRKLLLIKDQVVMEKSRKDLPPPVYSTDQSVLIRINHVKLLVASKSDAPLNSFQLRIAKVLLKLILITAAIHSRLL